MSGRLRRIVPRQLRRAGRRLLTEMPVRLRDMPRDIRDRIFRPRDEQMPPARLRYRVAGTSARASFDTVGRLIAVDLLRVAEPFLTNIAEPRTLDFGAGCGRVARQLTALLKSSELTGVDVDRSAIEWCSKHLPGNFVAIQPDSPLPFEAATFDFAYAVSIFTHLDAAGQAFWLSELARVLRPSGCLVITTLSPSLSYTRPDMSAADREQLQRTGFLYLPGQGDFNENSSFQTREFLAAALPDVVLVHHETHGLTKYQDIAVFTRARS